ncbi:DinB family protein [Fodinisporobacter ferrooxydans]|uniref:DinB family protein n=1 Tax=Fodinisporobacter ferrooxydans TaxID=2901836 RepID=UPI003D322607
MIVVTLSISKLYQYHIWANSRLILHLATLPETALYTEVSNVFPNILQTLGHIYSVDQTWLARIHGQHIERIVPIVHDSLEQVQNCFSCLGDEIMSVLQTYGDHDGKVIHYQNTKGDVFTNTLSEIIQHIVNHGTYHRGNVTSMLHQLGFTGVPTDYIVYLRAGRTIV